MGIQERRERHKREIKSSILNVAQQIIEKEGWQAVTIRRIADAIEYSVPTIYEYYESKEAILQELQHEWSRQMLTVLRKIQNSPYDPETVLRKVAFDYFDFVVTYPAFYKAIMGMEGISYVSSQDHLSEIQTIRSILKELIQDALGNKLSKHVDLDTNVDILRGFLHGISALFLIGKLKGGKERALILLQQGVQNYLCAWKQS